MNLNSLILASASPRRTDLLFKWNKSHRVIPSHAEELTQETASYFTPVELVQANAFLKAKVVAKTYEKVWVLGVDTVVVYQQKIFGKPRDLAEAHSMLQKLNGQTHQVISGLSLLSQAAHEFYCYLAFEISAVTFKKLALKEIRAYLKEVPVLDKAGAYAAQEKGDWLIESIQGSSSNVIGLPKRNTLELLQRVGL